MAAFVPKSTECYRDVNLILSSMAALLLYVEVGPGEGFIKVYHRSYDRWPITNLGIFCK